MKSWSAAEAANFAKEWEAGWNAHDLPTILAHFSPTVEFRSFRATAITGASVIKGKAALSAYWSTALTRQPDLRFTVQDVLTAPGMISILYLNQNAVQTIETLMFDAAGKVYFGAASRPPAR